MEAADRAAGRAAGIAAGSGSPKGTKLELAAMSKESSNVPGWSPVGVKLTLGAAPPVPAGLALLASSTGAEMLQADCRCSMRARARVGWAAFQPAFRGEHSCSAVAALCVLYQDQAAYHSRRKRETVSQVMGFDRLASSVDGG